MVPVQRAAGRQHILANHILSKPGKKRKKSAATARRVASGKPAPVITLCMVVKDEERFLPQCLESAASLVQEIVVVDTGSRDDTVAIATQFGARVLRQEWKDDFAAARNRALEAATGQWVLVLDADEKLDPRAAPQIARAVGEGGWDTGFLHFVNMEERGPSGREWLAARVLRRTPGLRYIGRIHEQAVHGLDVVRPRVIDAVVYHYGYQAAVFSGRQKWARNSRLLEQALESPEAQDPLLRSKYLFHHANLATNEELLRRYERLAAYIDQQWPQDPPHAPWITGGLAEYARILNDVGRYQESAGLARKLLEGHGESPMLHYLLARAWAAQGNLEEAEQELKHVLRSRPIISPEHMQYTQDLGLAVGRSRFLMGLIREKQGRLEEAVQHYRGAVEEEPDQDLLRRQLACALARLGRHQEALEALEGSADLVGHPQPGVDCLGLALALVTRSVARLGLWGSKVQQAATVFAPAARMLERVSQLGPEWRFRLEDFPELAEGVLPQVEPGLLAMPQTSRKSSELPR